MREKTQLIHGIETDGERITLAAFGSDRLALATGVTLQVVELPGTSATRVFTLALGSEPKSLRMSLSGSHVLSIDSERLRVWSRSENTPMFERPIDLAKTSVGALFARLGDREILLYEPAQAQLEAYDLASGDKIFHGATETFLAASAISIAGETQVALIGYFRGEGKDSLSVVPTHELTEPAHVLFNRFRKKRAIGDYAYRLAVGPCGLDAIVVFRDPEDDEDPDDDDESVADTSAHADVRGLHGFYVRRLDGTLITKRPWDGPVRSNAQLAATSTWIAASCGDQIGLVPIEQTSTSTLIDARWLSGSPDGSRVLIQNAKGDLSILDLRP